MIASLWIASSFFSCKPENPLKDGWWQNEAANPYPSTSSGEEELGEEWGEDFDEDFGEEPSEFWGFLFRSGTEYEGESGLYTPLCAWYSTLSGVEVDPCPDCMFALSVSFGDVETLNEENCSEEHSPSSWEGVQVAIGFGEEEAWIYREEWIPLGYSFQEGGGFGWYVELE